MWLDFESISPDLSVPDVDTLVKGAAGEVPAVGTEGHAVDGLLVAGQSVDAHAALHVPQTHSGVKRCTERRNRAKNELREPTYGSERLALLALSCESVDTLTSINYLPIRYNSILVSFSNNTIVTVSLPLLL